ncbi:FCD domain-containing protein [Variovorax sp. AFSI2.2]|uniref:FCD domain-containing protein n=1 Tax=Variovorax sp. AFSI2.2 TaxID=3384160 RepID=UPI003EB93039
MYLMLNIRRRHPHRRPSTSPLLLDLADVLFDNAERYRRWAVKFRQEPRRKHDEHQQLLNTVLARDA